MSNEVMSGGSIAAFYAGLGLAVFLLAQAVHKEDDVQSQLEYNKKLAVYSTGSGCLRALCDKGTKDGKKSFCLVKLDDYRELELKWLATLTEEEKKELLNEED